MAQIIHLPPNIVSREDREKLERFGMHLVAHGWATRWHWFEEANGDSIFQMYHDGEVESLAASVRRIRKRDVFCVHDAAGTIIAAGNLTHVFAELQIYFIHMHGGLPGSPA